jgi:cellobiose-specific phosphotransferase system component IIB
VEEKGLATKPFFRVILSAIVCFEESEMVNVFIVCGAGASSTFLSVKLRSLAQNYTRQLTFTPSALETLQVSASDVVVVASHIADDARVATISKTGVPVIKLEEGYSGGFDATVVLEQIISHLEGHKS